MTGYVQKHGKGWRYKIEFTSAEIEIYGRKSISKSGFKKESEAKKALREKLVEIDSGKYIEDKKTTIEEYLKEWLETHKTNISPSTHKRYSEFCNTINKHLGKIEILKLTPMTIQKFYSTLMGETELSNSTILKIHRCLNLALKQAVAWRLINNNPCQFVKAPSPEEIEVNVWDEFTVKKFLHESRGENIYIQIALALGTGMRQGEICALKWENVDLKKGEIYVRSSVKNINGELITKKPKTKSSVRRIPIPDDLKDLLVLHKKRQDRIKENNQKYKDEGYVCAWEDDGRLYDPQYIAKKFPKILKKYDVPMIRFHDLRHTHATLLLLHNVPAKVVSERLGHSSVNITLDIYSHVLPSMQKAAAEKLNGLFSSAQ
ncbi:tyrosine-type recombinase/integrase [Clostridium thermarum]|uniref:tyrosine-type recombinase/integrase n=1 Tax=Clostridium thermarum TaxID=1716543 RepID=UPI00111E6CF9|nr:tyrosine-type recombinase/integrase [Clostridium thermarum]